MTRNEVAESASRRQAQRTGKASASGNSKKGGAAEFLSAKMSQKVLSSARAQQAEVEEESRPRNEVLDRVQASFGSPRSKGASAGSAGGAFDDDEQYSAADMEADFGGNDEFVRRDGEFVEIAAEEEMDEADRRALESFMSKDSAPRLTLAEVIYQKIQEKKAQMAAAAVRASCLQQERHSANSSANSAPLPNCVPTRCLRVRTLTSACCDQLLGVCAA